VHVPDENEEWMKLELKRLTQFTRIFPKETRKDRLGGPGAPVISSEEALEAIEQENSDDEDEENGNDAEIVGIASHNASVKSSNEVSNTGNEKKTKSAVYEEILYQVCLLVKKIFLVNHCNLILIFITRYG
jgi:hypothetical protein